jgi:TRAP-type C4-dicarboxylate transport system substrate-binding protein
MSVRTTRLDRRHFLGLAAALPLTAALPRFAAADTAWRMATEYPASTVSGEGIAAFAIHLAKESNGRLTIAPAFEAAKSADILAEVRDGRLAAGCAFGGALGKIDPLFLLPSLPFTTATESVAHRLLDKARPLYATRLAREQQHLLYATPWPATGLWARKPIASPADLAGLKIRVYDATGVAVFTAAGAKPVNLSFADTMPKLIDGSIDAVLSSGDGGAGRKLWEYLPHFTEIGYALPLSFATLNGALHEGLSADLKGAVDRAAAATQADGWARLGKRLEENYARLHANKVTITANDRIDPALRALLAKSAASAVEAWKRDAGPEAASLLG